jgi:hypothetical protein
VPSDLPARRRHRPAPARAPDLGTIRADELVPLPVLRKRLGWGNKTAAQAQRDGLRATRYGHLKYVLGADVLAFFGRLAGDQGNGGPQP